MSRSYAVSASVLLILISVFVIISAAECVAAGVNDIYIPDSLKEWTGWVLHDKRDAVDCIPDYNDSGSLSCIWPTSISLDLKADGGEFLQQWHVNGRRYADLPGGESLWPRDVTVDGVVPTLISRRIDGNLPVPSIRLEPGDHIVRGSFSWKKIPESIQIPRDSALVKLRISGRDIESPDMDLSGRLWLKKESTEKKAENRLKIDIFRLIDDDIPSTVTIYFMLDASGDGRELKLGPVYSPGEFIPLLLDSDLKSKLELDGSLKVVVKPGRHIITVKIRGVDKITSMNFQPPEDGFWPKQEIWSVRHRAELRVAEVSGASPVDPETTSMPDEWRSYPAYLMLPGKSLVFKEIRRGDPDPPPDYLALRRTLWLSFDGSSYTVQDSITGKKNGNWRLEMDRSMQPGRVTVDGVEQLITSMKPEEKDENRASESRDGRESSVSAGVEIRRGAVNLISESTIRRKGSEIPATGWQSRFQNVSGVLNLPPGWRLIDAGGIDNISGTWIRAWSLFDIFIVMIFTIALGKLFSRSLAVTGFLTLILLFHEPGAPRYVWIALVIGSALLKNIPSGSNSMKRVRRAVILYQAVAFISLLLTAVPYAVNSLRTGFYPQLEKPWISMNVGADIQRSVPAAAPISDEIRDDAAGLTDTGESANAPEVEMQQMTAGRAPVRLMKSAVQAKGKLGNMVSGGLTGYSASESVYDGVSKEVMQYDPDALTQTGPGLPGWQPFRSINFSWSGPVEQGQKFSFLVTGPRINLILSIARVVLIILLAAGMFKKTGSGEGKENTIRKSIFIRIFRQKKSAFKIGNGVAVLFIPYFFLLFLLLPQNFSLYGFYGSALYAAEIPSSEMLQELQRRLLKTDECFPFCAEISDMDLSINSNQLDIRLEVNSAVASAIPVPGDTLQWIPGQILVNGEDARALFRRGNAIWVMIPEGKSVIEMRGAAGKNGDFQLPFPLRPHSCRVSNDASWEVYGIEQDGSLGNQLIFRRVVKNTSEFDSDKMESSSIPPFLLVERTIMLGLDWRVVTTVRRLNPSMQAVVINYPLIAGESVFTEGIRVKDGNARITLNSDQNEIIFESFLELSSFIKLHHFSSPEAGSSKTENSTTGSSSAISTDDGISGSTGSTDRESSSYSAAVNREWTEIWRLDASPIFHVETEGIPVILHQSNNRWLPTWHPWPGESVTLRISRPEGVKGRTFTIEKSLLDLTPGQRSTRAELTMSVRSSKGGQHTVTIAEGSELQEVSINGRVQPIRQEGKRVILPVNPGSSTLKLIWMEPVAISSLYRTPEVDLGSPGVNASLDLHLSYDRWPLFLGGDFLTGPAVLFWSVIIVIIVLSAALSMTGLTPLRFHEWLCLGIGMSMSSSAASLVVALWIVVLDLRKRFRAGKVISGSVEISGSVKDGSDKDGSDKDGADNDGADNDGSEQKISNEKEKIRSERGDKIEDTQASKTGTDIKVSLLSPWFFNLMQVAIAFLTLTALMLLVNAISQGLLGHPSMSISGNGSTATFLRWFHDISGSLIPRAWVISLPMSAYRITMLLWALWISFLIIRILKWGWHNYAGYDLWASSSESGNPSGEPELQSDDKNRGTGIRKLFRFGRKAGKS